MSFLLGYFGADPDNADQLARARPARLTCHSAHPGPRPAVAATGLLDVTANALFLVATRHGLLSLVALLSSLYPATTVVLARAVLGERFTRTQVVSLAAAGTGVALIALG